MRPSKKWYRCFYTALYREWGVKSTEVPFTIKKWLWLGNQFNIKKALWHTICVMTEP